MRKGLFLFLMTLTSQLLADQYTDGSAFFFADALVWKLRAGSADNWAQEITPAGTNQTVKLVGVPFKWDPGFRVGIGYNNCGNDWDTIFSSTYFQTKGVSHASATSGGISSAFLGNFFVNNIDGKNFGPAYRNANIHWKTLFNIYDLELGHTVECDQFLKLRPFIGLKGGVINHTIHTNWQNPTVATTFTSATENLKNNFWGVGPSLGLNTTWTLYGSPKCAFNIIGNFSGALMFGHWRFSEVYTNNTPTSVAIQLRSVNGAATMARGLIGLEWIGYFSKANVAVRLGYEAQVWFNQMQYYSFNRGRLNNLMSLQGGVLGFNLNF